MTITASANTTGAAPRLPAAELSQIRRGIDATLVGSTRPPGLRGHAGGASAPEPAIPATLVGLPAVIACTTSCWVVSARS